MNKYSDSNHTGQYRVQLVTTNYRKAGHEYLATKALAIKRRSVLARHGYRVLLYLIDQQGQRQPIAC